MKSGFVTLVGRTNVGKSTIINKIIDKKISIVSNKSQTTRNIIKGIYNDDESQIIFLDTPGIHKPRNDLGVVMDRLAYSSLRSGDLAVFVVDSSKEFNEGDKYILSHLKIDCPLIIVFNKIDLTNIILINKLKEIYSKAYPHAKLIEVCGKDGFNISDLIKEIKNILPEGPKFYDNETFTDISKEFFIQEIIREKCLNLLDKEVPHSLNIICEKIVESDKKNKCYCIIVCEKESQKSILIGKKGNMVKEIGIKARNDLEEIFKKHFFLDIVIRVEEDWRNSAKIIKKWN